MEIFMSRFSADPRLSPAQATLALNESSIRFNSNRIKKLKRISQAEHT
jgi:hypothetical protein